jgi:GNAT superfamily N-acetyltransferase
MWSAATHREPYDAPRPRASRASPLTLLPGSARSLLTGAMLIEQFDAKTDDDRLAACHQISVSGHAEDDPNVPEVTWRRFQAWWRYGFGGEPIETWLATDDEQHPIGCYLLWLPERENRQNALISLSVARGGRRQGLGTALVGHAAGQAERAGRTLLMSGHPGWCSWHCIRASLRGASRHPGSAPGTPRRRRPAFPGCRPACQCGTACRRV